MMKWTPPLWPTWLKGCTTRAFVYVGISTRTYVSNRVPTDIMTDHIIFTGSMHCICLGKYMVWTKDSSQCTHASSDDAVKVWTNIGIHVFYLFYYCRFYCDFYGVVLAKPTTIYPSRLQRDRKSEFPSDVYERAIRSSFRITLIGKPIVIKLWIRTIKYPTRRLPKWHTLHHLLAALVRICSATHMLDVQGEEGGLKSTERFSTSPPGNYNWGAL